MITANSGRSPKAVAPFGGAKARLGTNPICFAIPSNLEGPLLFDMATSAAAAGKINVATARGEQVPSGWLIDAEGKPSTDPRVLSRAARCCRWAAPRATRARPGGDRRDSLRAVDRPWVRRRTDRPAQRWLLHCGVQRRGVPRPGDVQAGSDRIRALPEGDAAGAGLHRGALSRRDRVSGRSRTGARTAFRWRTRPGSKMRDLAQGYGIADKLGLVNGALHRPIHAPAGGRALPDRARAPSSMTSTLPGQAWMHVVRSPHAHAVIDRIDTAAARAMPGVLGVSTPMRTSPISGCCRAPCRWRPWRR